MSSSGGPARIWHIAGSFHPIPQAATVIAVGGSDENIFRADEPSIHNVGKTSLFDFGEVTL